MKKIVLPSKLKLSHFLFWLNDRKSWCNSSANILIVGKFILFLLLLPLFLNNCSVAVKQLQGFKDRHAMQDYQWLAAQEITCDSSSTDCNQLHLIKGDACFQLAKRGIEEEKHYECAANELEIGIRLTKQWDLEGLNLNRAQIYENYCESLSKLQDYKRGEEAKKIQDRFYVAASEFISLEPENFAAIYYDNKARFQKLQPELNNITDENKQSLCNAIYQMLETVEETISRAERIGTDLWDKYKEKYDIFKNKLIIIEKHSCEAREFPDPKFNYKFEIRNNETFLSVQWTMEIMDNCDSLQWELLANSEKISGGRELEIRGSDVKLTIPLKDDFPDGIYDLFLRCFSDGIDRDRDSITFRRTGGIWIK